MWMVVCNCLFVEKVRSLEAFALALLDKELFVLTQSSPKLRVCDTAFNLRGSVVIPMVSSPCSFVDIVACSFHYCLYIADARSKCIFRLEMPSKCKKWEVEGLNSDAVVTVTHKRHLLILCGTVTYRKLTLFSTVGVLLNTVKLHPSFHSVTSAVELTPGQYVITQGRHDDDFHRVRVIDSAGKILHMFGGFRGSLPTLLDSPSDVAVDKDGFVYVDDEKNDRLIVLTQELDYIHCMQRIFTKSKGDVRRRMKLDKQLGLFYVRHMQKWGDTCTYYTTLYKI